MEKVLTELVGLSASEKDAFPRARTRKQARHHVSSMPIRPYQVEGYLLIRPPNKRQVWLGIKDYPIFIY
jgi:hypothetical protein